MYSFSNRHFNALSQFFLFCYDTGKTFFQDDSKYLAPAIWGYTYGAGLRVAFHAFTLAGGIRNTHEYFHTYYEQPISDKKENEEFMLDFDVFLQPYVSLTIDLF